MRKKQILAAMLMLVATGASVHAENFARQTVQATLPAYVDIKAEDGGLHSNIKPETGELENTITSKFTIKSNDKLSLYLKAETIADGGTVMPGFFQKGGVEYIVLGHTTLKPSVAAISDITSGSATPEYNQNAIAYPISGVEIQGKLVGDVSFNDAKKQFEFKVDQGISTALTTISNAVDSTTYSFDDRAGNYEAYIILTDTTT